MYNPKYKANKKNGGNIPPVIDQRTIYVPIGCGVCIECRKQNHRRGLQTGYDTVSTKIQKRHDKNHAKDTNEHNRRNGNSRRRQKRRGMMQHDTKKQKKNELEWTSRNTTLKECGKTN